MPYSVYFILKYILNANVMYVYEWSLNSSCYYNQTDEIRACRKPTKFGLISDLEIVTDHITCLRLS